MRECLHPFRGRYPTACEAMDSGHGLWNCPADEPPSAVLLGSSHVTVEGRPTLSKLAWPVDLLSTLKATLIGGYAT